MTNSRMQNLDVGLFVSWMQRCSVLAIRVGRVGVVALTPLFITYLSVGVAATSTQVLELPYPFLSLSGDPVLNFLAFLIGSALLLLSGGLFVLISRQGIRDVRNQLAVILVMASIGFSSAVLWYTSWRTVEVVTTAFRSLLGFP